MGYILSEHDPFTCIDLDVKADTPAEQLERHESIVATMASYTERSRSGLGRHVWVRAEVGRGCRRDGVELYSRERFIICTGDVVCDLPVEDRQDLISNMASRMRPQALPDAELRPDEPGEDDMGCCIAGVALDDQGEMGRLMRGDWQGLNDAGARKYPSQSEADLTLMLMLGRLTEANGACREAFRDSLLGRRDKARCDDRYLNLTLRKARSILADDAFHVAEGSRIAGDIFWPEPAWTPPGGSARLRLLLDGDLDALPPLRWLVKGIIPDAGIGAIYGASGTFKSFLTLDLLAHVSNGREWFGHRVKAAPAVYVPFEGQGGISKRIRAWRLAQTMARHPQNLATFEPDADVLSRVAVIMEPLSLREQADRDKLVAGLKEQGWAGGVLCFDTLAQAANGIDENSSAMGEMIGICRELQQRLGGVVLLVHHSGKDESRGMRGWSGLHAAMDFVIECQKKGEPDAKEAAFSLAKVKDGATGTAFGFRMQLLPLGFDEDGDAVTSLTVCPATPGEGAEHTFVDESREAADDDAFVDAWVRELMIAGSQPTGRWLEAARPHVAEKRKLTQKRLRDAICRLKACGRLEDAPDSLVKNGKWLRAVDVLKAVQ